VDVAVQALHRLGLGNSTSPAGLKWPVDGLDAELDGEVLIAPVGVAFQVGERFPPLGFL
jgi:hypothetical protein